VPADPPLVAPPDLTATVQGIVSQVLMIPVAGIQPDTRLSDLGAESIDYLDLLFRIEDAIGKKVPVSRWEAFVNERLPGANLSDAITVAILVEFAGRERGRA
jgi:Acyl carrier protein